MNTILVTGAAGLLGRALVPMLRQKACVIAADRSTLDLAKPLDASALPANIDAVIYLAQSRGFRNFPEATDDIFSVNVSGAVALARHAQRAGASHFIYASSGGVYAPSEMPITEAAPLSEPLGFYHASKRAAEHLLFPFAPYLTVIMLRYFFIYGRNQNRDMLVPRLFDSVREGRSVTLQGSDGLRFNPIHVSDAARATVASLNLSHSATINVAGPQAMSLRDLCEDIGTQVGRPPRFVSELGQKPSHLVADIRKMKTLLCEPTRLFAEAHLELLER